MFWGNFKNRYSILSIIVLLVTFVFVYRLFELQIVKGSYYRKQSELRLLKSMPIRAPRGVVLDRYGRPLASNRMGFSIHIYKTDTSEEQLNNIILNIQDIIDDGTSFVDNIPISKELPLVFQFQDDSKLSKAQQEEKWKKGVGIDIGASAQQTIEILGDRYKITKDLSYESIRRIIATREDMKLRHFSANNSYMIATDISKEAVMKIEERHLEFPGVYISVEPVRNYAYKGIASHILGRVGVIYAEEYDKLREKGYGMNDILGKDGIEKLVETHLKGKDGSRRVEQNVEGKITQVLDSIPPNPGNDVILTIDGRVQKAAEEALESNILRIRDEGARLRRPGSGEDANSGAVVVMDVNTGGILAMASYPSYDPTRFNYEYKQLLSDELKPMLNRAISGTYSPGSTFKPLTAIAALEENIISPSDRITDKGVYTFYGSSGYTPRCWIHQAKYGFRTHGSVNVSEAIRDSCNYFFYDVGRRLTIEKIDGYAQKFGLGELTGIEMPGESKGVLGGPESKKRLYNQPWYPGETLGAAIGEMHAFTPIQLASYVSTLSNGGKRYRAHIVKRVKDQSTGENLIDVNPEVLSQVNIKHSNLSAVLEGMRSVTGEDGTASSAFRGFPITVAGKTGTAQRRDGSDNGIFVGFAPYENPQIALAIVIEHGKSGSNTAPVARHILTEYFGLGKKEYDEIIINSFIP